MRSFQNASILVTGIICALTTTGRAQDAYPNVAPSTLDAYMSSHIDGLSLKGSGNSGRSNRSRRGSASSGTLRTNPTTRVSTSYTPSATVSAQIRDKAIKQIRAISSADADKIASALQKTTAAALWQRTTSDYGLRSNDMADAMAAYWVINYMVVNDLQTLPAASVRGARNQFQRLLLGTAALAQKSNAEKQRLAEELYFRYLFQHGAFQHANKLGDSGQKAQLSKSARTQFRDQMGIDLQEFTLTRTGFLEKS